jgi:hypothetical protein
VDNYKSLFKAKKPIVLLCIIALYFIMRFVEKAVIEVRDIYCIRDGEVDIISKLVYALISY